MSQRGVKHKGAVHTVPKLYACYLLRSIPKPKSFYIGSSPDPVRRLRQHNGELTAGAWKTKKKGYRPWEMLMVVYGFPNKIAALQVSITSHYILIMVTNDDYNQFEHAWQHSFQTRHIDQGQRITKSKTAGRSLDHKLGNVRLLLNANYFSRMNLRIQLFNTEVYRVWCLNKFGISLRNDLIQFHYDDAPSGDDSLNFKSVQNFKQKQIAQDERLLEKFKEVIQIGKSECSLCHSDIDYIKDDSFPLVSICYHESCTCLIHLQCLFNDFQKQRPTIEITKSKKRKDEIVESDLIPVKGRCPGCSKIVIWTDVVRNSTMIRTEVGYDGKVPPSQMDTNLELQLDSQDLQELSSDDEQWKLK